MSLLNSDMNVRQKERDDMLKNNRSISGNMPYKAPDVSNMGQLSENVKEYNPNSNGTYCSRDDVKLTVESLCGGLQKSTISV